MINWQQLLGPLGQTAGRMGTTVFNPNSGATGLKGSKPPAPGSGATKTPWLQREGFGGLSKGDLLLAGMGMLSGRSFGEGLSNASAPLYGAMERQREEAAKRDDETALTEILTADGKMTPEQAAAYARFGPQVAIGQRNRGEDLEIDAERFGKTEAWREKDWAREGEWRDQDVDWRETTAERDEERWQAGHGLEKDKFGYMKYSDAEDRKLKAAAIDAEIQAAMAKAGGNNPAGLSTDQIKLEADFSNKWTPIQENYRDIAQQYGRITTLGSDTRPDGTPVPAAQRAVNDLALVVAFTKMLDPGSVAREGEVELTKKAASLIGEAQTWLPRLQKGQTLLPEATRKALVDAAKDMMPLYDDAYQKTASDNISRINQYGMSPERIMLGYEFGQGSGQPGPNTGPTEFGDVAQIPEGALVEDESGARYRKQGGQLVKVWEF